MQANTCLLASFAHLCAWAVSPSVPHIFDLTGTPSAGNACGSIPLTLAGIVGDTGAVRVFDAHSSALEKTLADNPSAASIVSLQRTCLSVPVNLSSDRVRACGRTRVCSNFACITVSTFFQISLLCVWLCITVLLRVCVLCVDVCYTVVLVCDDTPVHIKVWGKAPACLQGYVGRTCDGKLWPTPAHAVWPWREHTVSCVYARKLHSLSHAHTNTHTRTHAQSRTHTQSHVCMSHV